MDLRRSEYLSLLVLVAVLIWMGRPCPAFAEKTVIELDTIEAGGIAVHYERPLLNAAKEILELYPAIKHEVEKTLRWEVRFRPEVLLIRENRTFRMLAHSEMVVAFADPERQLIVIDYSRMGMHPFRLDITFKHELCHLLLHSHIPHGLPKWFDEGVSQWVTGGLAEILVEDRKPVLKEAALARRIFRFEALSLHFPEDRPGLILAYEQSRSLVEYMADTFGAQKLLDILEALKDGTSIDDALRKHLGLALPVLEGNWLAHLNKNITWLIYLSNNLYEILFFLAALITIFAGLKMLLRRLARKDTDEEDEGDDPESRSV
jgi:hypothetical protein